MKLNFEANKSEGENREAEIQERWKRFSQNVFTSGREFPVSEIPELDQWETWVDWGTVFDQLQQTEMEANRYGTSFFERETYPQRLAGFSSILTALFVNTNFFNELRQKFPVEDYKKAWNLFFDLCRVFPVDTVDLHRVLNLNGVDFSDLKPSGLMNEFVRLEGANLRGADLRKAYLKNASFKGADARDAKFDGARMPGGSIGSGIDFTEAKVDGASFVDVRADLPPKGLPQWAVDQMKIRR